MKKPIVKIKNFGIYTNWNKRTSEKELPELLKYTDKIPAQLQIEFGYILHIVKGKGLKIDFHIDHPPFCDKFGMIAPPFKGEMHINSNDFFFFLGDTLWEPIEDKIGAWVLKSFIKGELVAEKTLFVEHTKP